MDDDDRSSASSAESEREEQQDAVMEDVDENDNDNENENEEENNEEDEDGEGDADADGDQDADADNDGDDAGAQAERDGDAAQDESQDKEDGDKQDTDGSAEGSASKQKSDTPLSSLPWRPTVRPEAMTARLYDIVPTMAAPQSTSVNAMAITPNLRYWFTGGSDGYIRKYDGPGTINGKLTLTVAQKHPFVDSVTKAGILMSYWENEEPAPPGRGEQEHTLSPVYSLAVHSEALWLLSGLESGGINLQSVRHDEGKKIACLQQHSNAVSVLTLAQDEKSVLSGGWDKNVFDWDLNTGQTKRSFDGNGGQISAIELRPASGDPVPAEADEPLPSSTISSNNGLPITNGNLVNGINGGGKLERGSSAGNGEGEASPAHESLFGGSDDDAGSLFGDTAGGQPFGHDDDEYNTGMGMMPGESGMDHSADMAMAGMDMGKERDKEAGAQAGDAMDVDASTTQQTLSQPEPPLFEENEGAAPEQSASEPMPQDTSQPPDESTDRKDHQPADTEMETQDPTLKRSQSRSQSRSPALLGNESRPQFDPSQMSTSTFLSAAMDGCIRIWDRRAPNPVARIGTRPGVPPWCMSACWSPDGNMIYAGRRNGTVEEYDVRKAKRGWEPERSFKFPAGSGAVSAVKPMMNGRHLICASHDILRLYDLRDTRAFKHSTVPFLIVPGPPRAGVISGLYVDPTSRFMLSAAGTRGWDGTSTEVLIGYEINCLDR